MHENQDDRIHRKDVLNAFRPDGEMLAPSGFAGRKAEVLQLVDALCVDGSCPIIYGERGLGKSSLANQMRRIALGDVELLHKIGAEDRALREKDRFVVFWVNCSDETTGKKDLFRRIINQAEGYTSLNALPMRDAESIVSTDRIDLKFVTSETKTTYSKKAFQALDVEEQLLAVIDSLRKRGHKRLMFIIDEIDRLGRTDGLAGFLKNESDDDTKFMLVGIADNISSLLHDHESLARHVHPVKMPLMSNDELEEIVVSAMAHLNQEHDITITFSNDALEALARAARGFPWFVHLLGQDALLRVWGSGKPVVNASDIERSINDLAQNKFSQEFGDRYRSTVGESYQREVIIRIMARWKGRDIPLSEVYKIAKRLAVVNPSQHKRDLERKKYGEIIINQRRGFVRFNNALFKRYVDLRQSLFVYSHDGNISLGHAVNEFFDAHIKPVAK